MKKLFLILSLLITGSEVFSQATAKQEIEQQIVLWHDGLVKGDLNTLMA